MEEVNRRRRTVLQVQVGELHLWCLNQSSSPRKCTSHLGLSLVSVAPQRRLSLIRLGLLVHVQRSGVAGPFCSLVLGWLCLGARRLEAVPADWRLVEGLNQYFVGLSRVRHRCLC